MSSSSNQSHGSSSLEGTGADFATINVQGGTNAIAAAAQFCVKLGSKDRPRLSKGEKRSIQRGVARCCVADEEHDDEPLQQARETGR